MKLTLNNRDKFRFTEKFHVHEMLVNDAWQKVPGCSSIAGMFDDKGWFGYWAAGLALAPLGWKKLERDGSNKEEVFEAAINGLNKVESFIDDQLLIRDINGYADFLDKCYKAHAKETKDTATSGTELHKWLEIYVGGRIEGMESTTLIPEKFIPQINKFRDWEDENQVEWLASELQVGSLMFQYAGILDFVAKINGRIVLGDFKTSSGFKDTYIPQLVGLKQATQEMGQPIDDLMVVRLSRDGGFEVHPVVVDFETELMAFLKAKEFYNQRNLFKARHK